METKTKTGSATKTLVVGALVGAAVGLLVAPQPGKQTRNLIRSKTGGYAGTLRARFQKNGAVSDSAEDHATISG